MIRLQILTTSLIHFSLKGWENVIFELGSERAKSSTVVAYWRYRMLDIQDLVYDCDCEAVCVCVGGGKEVCRIQKQLIRR